MPPTTLNSEEPHKPYSRGKQLPPPEKFKIFKK